jgi:hypothetical protein
MAVEYASRGMEMRRAARVSLGVVALMGAAPIVSSCRRGTSSDGASEAAGSASASAALAAPSLSVAPAASSSAPLVKAPLQLLRFHFTSSIHGKEPEDDVLAAAPGDRVYAHVALRNRSGEARKITMTFRVNGEKRTTLDLEVQPSWSFRTWGFNTLRKGDAGELSVDVVDDASNVLVDEKIPIATKPKKKPL